MNFSALTSGSAGDDKLLIGIVIAFAVAIAWRMGLFKNLMAAKASKPITPSPMVPLPATPTFVYAPPPPAAEANSPRDIEDLLLEMQRRDDKESDGRLLRDRQRIRENESLAKALQRRQEPAK